MPAIVTIRRAPRSVMVEGATAQIRRATGRLATVPGARGA